MLSEKMVWARGLLTGGNLFALFGLLNLAGYGLSLTMEKQNHDEYYLYQGKGRFFSIIKSFCGSDSFLNVAWTAPVLIFGGLTLTKTLGALNSTKFFGLALVASYLGVSAFGAHTMFSNWGISQFLP